VHLLVKRNRSLQKKCTVHAVSSSAEFFYSSSNQLMRIIALKLQQNYKTPNATHYRYLNKIVGTHLLV